MAIALPTHANEACGPWLQAEIDASDGKYSSLLQLRSCDLTGGVSAFLQLQSGAPDRLKLTYRAHSEEKSPKDGELILEPGEIKRGATCQQCSRRKGGVTLWEIVAVEVLAPVSAVSNDASPATNAASTVAVDPEKNTPVPAAVVKPVPPAPTPPAVSSSEPAPVAPKADKASEEKKTEEKKLEEKPVAPWDQLPPEFRPRN